MADVPNVPLPAADSEAPAEPRGRVVDLSAWHDTPGMRVVRPPRALFRRHPSSEPIRPATIVPVSAPAPRGGGPVAWPSVPDQVAPLPGPLLVVACAESRVVEQLRQHLPVGGVLQNLGGVMPRIGRSVRVQADVATVDAAIEHCGIRHLVCVGHLGCRIAEGSGAALREPTRETEAEVRRRQQRAVEQHVFTQLQRVRAYLRKRPAAPGVRLSGLWVDERTGSVHAFDPVQRRFAPLASFDLLRYSMLAPTRGSEGSGQGGGADASPGAAAR